ncbi:MAG: hypothetical protein ACK53Y_04170, partial [bacterium]
MVKQTVRSFGGAAHHDHHDDHHGHDDHHHHVEKADGDHKFITKEGSDKRFLFFNGLKATAPATIVVENPYRHHNDLPLINHGHYFSGYAFAMTFEEDPKVHDEPYGYELGDDPFEEQGQGDYPWMLLFAGIICFTHFCHAHFRFDRRKTGEVLYHQRLMAFQIEDKIREMRLA